MNWYWNERKRKKCWSSTSRNIWSSVKGCKHWDWNIKISKERKTRFHISCFSQHPQHPKTSHFHSATFVMTLSCQQGPHGPHWRKIQVLRPRLSARAAWNSKWKIFNSRDRFSFFLFPFSFFFLLSSFFFLLSSFFFWSFAILNSISYFLSGFHDMLNCIGRTFLIEEDAGTNDADMNLSLLDAYIEKFVPSEVNHLVLVLDNCS